MSFNFVPSDVFEVTDEADDLLDLVQAGNAASSKPPVRLQVFNANAVAMLLSNVWFGNGADGDLILENETMALTRDMYFNNLTIKGGGVVDCQNFRLFVCGTLDLSLADAGAINANGIDGASAIDETIGQTFGVSSGTFAQRTPAGQGEAGSTSNTHPNVTRTIVNGAQIAGGVGGGGGKGGGSYTQSIGSTYNTRDIRNPTINPATDSAAPVHPGFPGLGGLAGLGDGASSIGGAGGNGGGAGGYLWIAASEIKWGNNANAGVLQANGGNAGNGGNGQGANASGGGGGGGGGGGVIHLVFGADDRASSRSSAVGRTELLTANGGTGGTGGTKVGTGIAGSAGEHGQAGAVFIYDVGTGTAFFDRNDEPGRTFSCVIPA